MMSPMTPRESFDLEYADICDRLWAVCTAEQHADMVQRLNRLVRRSAEAARATVLTRTTKEGAA